MSVNKVILIGRLGKDPETRYTSGGTAVSNFSIACDESYKDKSGERQKRTEWVNLVLWGKTAELAKEYLHKGAMAYFEGRLQTRKWQDKEGNDRYSTEVVVTEMKFLQTDKNKQNGGGQATGSDFDGAGGINDEDIPF
jgi:single-strand DNA-binding protein